MDNTVNICPNLMPTPIEYSEPDILDCFYCWKDNANIQRDKVKLNNPKYCWLYPKHERKEFKAILPNFQHCKTLYTKCDNRLERSTHEIILKLEDQFKTHNILMEKELKMQNELMDDIWIDSQKYLILTGSGVCVKPYPEIISASTEKRVLCGFHVNLQKVHESNYHLTKSLEEIRTTMAELNRSCDRLDYTVDSPFLLGTYYMKPLNYIRSTIDDLFNYFYQHLRKVKCWAELLHPGDSVAIEDYVALIKPSKNYESNLMEYLQQCCCMRSKKKECIKKHIPC